MLRTYLWYVVQPSARTWVRVEGAKQTGPLPIAVQRLQSLFLRVVAREGLDGRRRQSPPPRIPMVGRSLRREKRPGAEGAPLGIAVEATASMAETGEGKETTRDAREVGLSLHRHGTGVTSDV